MTAQTHLPVLLTIAGSDSGGGAGIQADLKTFAAHGVFGCSAITAVTAQNTRGVTAVEILDAGIVRAQIESVLNDLNPAAIKIGMLANEEIIRAVAGAISEVTVPIVLDPVMVATSGDQLLASDAVGALKQLLLPHATLLTPNLAEAEVLLGEPVRDRSAMTRAAISLSEQFGTSVLVKGGHLADSHRAVDILASGNRVTEISSDFIESTNTHGTGCTLSSAIAARLALGHDLTASIRLAKAYVTEAIRHAPDIGGGSGPLRHQIPLPGLEY